MSGNDLEAEEKAKLDEERRHHREVLEDSNSNQRDRDWAHLRLQDIEEAARSDNGGLIDSSDYFTGLPEAWIKVEANELGVIPFSDSDLVVLAEEPLLRDKCKTVRIGTLRNGNSSHLAAYPKLAAAIQNLLDACDQQAIASAYAVKGWLIRLEDLNASVQCFKNAIRIRPQDWRLHQALATSYMGLGKYSMALEAMTKAFHLTEADSFDRFMVERQRAFVFDSLKRWQDAKSSLLHVLINTEKYKELLDPVDVGNFVALEYMMCPIYLSEGNVRMGKHHWDSAEAKRNALSETVRNHNGVSWKHRTVAQACMAVVDPNLLSHQECHHCRKLASDPKQCARCKSARYCSKECQIADWKAGHKLKCKQATADRRSHAKEKKAYAQKRDEVSKLPPLDATLDPRDLWVKAESADTAEDAVFYFTVALFLDSSLGAESLVRAKAAVDSMPQDHPLALALGMITHVDVADPYGHIGDHITRAQEYLNVNDVYIVDPHYKSLEDVNRFQFGFAMCLVFQARVKTIPATLSLLNQVDQVLEKDRWLTIQQEFGYRNIQVGAFEEGKYWLDKFVNNLNELERNDGSLTGHWTKSRTAAREKIETLPAM